MNLMVSFRLGSFVLAQFQVNLVVKAAHCSSRVDENAAALTRSTPQHSPRESNVDKKLSHSISANFLSLSPSGHPSCDTLCSCTVHSHALFTLCSHTTRGFATTSSLRTTKVLRVHCTSPPHWAGQNPHHRCMM
eukprot:3457216-Rhodomonas_salina.1